MEKKSEEELMLEQQEQETIVSNINVPYFLFNDEISETGFSNYSAEIIEIKKYYQCYKLGAPFLTEGSNSDYVPSRVRFKKARMIVNKEARFLFSNPPTFNVNPDDVEKQYAEENAIIQDYLDKVLEKNNFNNKLLKALKDCFIGKRVAIVLNFNTDGITITFLNSLEFIYEMNKEEEIVKFITFYNMNHTTDNLEKRWFRKKYSKNDKGVFLEETIWDGTGKLIKTVKKNEKIKFDRIPAFVVINDGLTGEIKGESELGYLLDYESLYSRLSNSDVDAERKSMNPIRYTIDASTGSTKDLSTSPGSYWDLQSDEDKSEPLAAKVGTLEAQMNYSVPLKKTLDRVENEMYAELDVPNINSEQLAGVITSGKTIQALYWGLTVRCDEKMLSWGVVLVALAEMIIEGGKLYPKCISKYIDTKIPEIPYTILVENNYPIPEDVKDEKETDILEVESKVMSKKSYLKKWRKLNDEEAEKELEQIKREYDLFENSVDISVTQEDVVDDGEDFIDDYDEE